MLRFPFHHLTAAGLLAAACSGDASLPIIDGGGADEADAGPAADAAPPACMSNRTFFDQRVWAPVLAKKCLSCHAPEGIATEQNAKLQLLPASYPLFLDTNLASVTFVARIQYDGISELLLKPTGRVEHGGEDVLEVDSDEVRALEEFIARLDQPDTCVEPPADYLAGVTLLSPARTLRKATLALAGRPPTVGELERLDAEGESALPELLAGVMEEEAFYEIQKELWNDTLLTDRYLSYAGAGVALLNTTDYPLANTSGTAVPPTWWSTLGTYDRYALNSAIAREPLELIEHVLRERLPFTEVLTADYTVVNPWSAQLYQVDVAFADPTDPNEFREARVSFTRPGETLSIPHSGILTTPVFLNRFPTSATNHNRHRALMLFKFFLATDILALAERPIDPTTSTMFANPERDDPYCSVCHRIIDPVAGAFMKWNANDQERYFPTTAWHEELFPPGFGAEVMPTTEYEDATRWVAERIVADPRFAFSIVGLTYRGLFGAAPLAYPETDRADFDARLRAWRAQDDLLRRLAEAFVASGYELRVVIEGLVLSPWFRAERLAAAPAPGEEAAQGELGAVRLLTPEALARKLAAMLGVGWVKSDRTSYLTTDYRIAYGGIDSLSVTTRLATPNGVMAALLWRMANEVACAHTARDFTKPIEERTLFPHVSLLHVPEIGTGDAVPGAIAAIKRNLRHLHLALLDEDLPEGDPELDASYAVFYGAWRAGQEALTAGTIGTTLEYACRGRVDLETGTVLPTEQQLTYDPGYTVRAWMAVVTYLLADHRFVHE